MGTSENVLRICESLQLLGYPCASDKIHEAIMHSIDDPLAIVRLALDTAVTSERNTKYEKCLRISKLGDPVFFRDLLPYKVRQLSFLVCKHRHSGVAETANPGSGNRESGNAETAITVMSYGCRI